MTQESFSDDFAQKFLILSVYEKWTQSSAGSKDLKQVPYPCLSQ
jgi:hypothetical protein